MTWQAESGRSYLPVVSARCPPCSFRHRRLDPASSFARSDLFRFSAAETNGDAGPDTRHVLFPQPLISRLPVVIGARSWFAKRATEVIVGGGKLTVGNVGSTPAVPIGLLLAVWPGVYGSPSHVTHIEHSLLERKQHSMT
jgi:hypothetical protein